MTVIIARCNFNCLYHLCRTFYWFYYKSGSVSATAVSALIIYLQLYRHERFWNWSQLVLPWALVTSDWYNGDPPYDQRGFLGDKVNRRLGPAWMRQVRVVPGNCSLIFMTEFHTLYF